MGFFDFLKRKPAPPVPLALPVEGTIAAYDSLEGTLTLAGGRTLKFSSSACQGFEPIAGLVVSVESTTPHPVDGLRALQLRLVTERAEYEQLLRAQRESDAVRRQAAAAGLNASALRKATVLVDAKELEKAPPGTRAVLTVRLENVRKPQLFFRELTLDGRVLRVLAAQAQLATPTQFEQVHERYGQRFSTEAAALKAFETLLAQNQRSYEKTTRTVQHVPLALEEHRTSSNVELEQAFERSRDAATARVLSDWYQTQGDLRGELAALVLAGSESKALTLLETNATALLGELDVSLHAELRAFTWANGFVRGASLKRRHDGPTDLATLTQNFLALPIARFVTELRFGLTGYEINNDWTEVLRVVASSSRAPFIRKLEFDDFETEESELSWVAFGDFSEHLRKLPALEWLHIRSGEGGQLGELDLPNLKTFIRESGGLSAAEIDSIVRAKWPKLERLDVWLGSEAYGAEGTVELVQPLLDNPPVGLKHLGLVNNEITPALLRALLDSKVLPQLEVLDLSMGVLMDADVEVLLQRADAVRHLTRLDVSQNLLETAGERLKAALPNVVVNDQRFEGEGDRYCAVGE